MIQRLRTPSLFSSWVRLVTLSLLLGLGLLAGSLLVSKPAHARSLASTTITDCSSDTQLQSAISSASSGDTITFGCSGDILLSKTLTIATNLTLDGSGQSVTLDGGNSVQVLNVNSGITFTLNALTIAHGSSTYDGGGLINDRSTVNINNSTFANNSAPGTFGRSSSGYGGGLENAFGTVNINNSTFANNNSSADGGGLFTNGGTVNINNSTFASNSARNAGSGLYNNGSLMEISGSIVANNTGNNCGGSSLTDQGYNLSSDSSCHFTSTSSLQNTDPKLDPNGLQNNGGPTQTIALQQGSPAIDQIPVAQCPQTDQRGMTRPDDSETACDMGAYESNYKDNDLGLSNMPGNITTNATSPQGAVVTYTAPTVVDEDSPLPTANCSPASGSTFAIGTTTVTCTATDSDDVNSPVSQSFQVTVQDTLPPSLQLPSSPVTANATGPQGATVNYTVTATDPVYPPNQLIINCTPASGSTFAIGTTAVNCTVTDPAGNSASGSFQVVVNGATSQVSSLVTTVNSFNLPHGIQNSFDSQLQAVQADLSANNTAQACSDLTSFINHARAQSGKALTVSQANQLIAAATQIKAVLGC